MTVDPVEVTDGYCWKVNFRLETQISGNSEPVITRSDNSHQWKTHNLVPDYLVTHVRARYNGPAPKINQNLGVKVDDRSVKPKMAEILIFLEFVTLPPQCLEP